MRPVLRENRLHHRLVFFYIIIFIICTTVIGIALYIQYFEDEKIELVLGITDNDSEQEDEYNDLKSEFSIIFTNELEIMQTQLPNIKKIRDNYDIVITAYSYLENQENYTLNVSVPYINAKNEIAVNFNKSVKEKYKEKADSILNDKTKDNVIYIVEYKAYIQNNILSIVIREELKEGNKSQKIAIDTFNYDFVKEKEIYIQELLNLKNITEVDANKKIENEIKKVQEQNDILEEQGYILYKRDYTSERYDIQNTEQYFIGRDGMLYVIYPYGNNDYTSEMDIVIFK